MIIQRKNLPYGRWVYIVNDDAPGYYRYKTLHADQVSVLVETKNGKQRLDLMFTQQEVIEMLRRFGDVR